MSSFFIPSQVGSIDIHFFKFFILYAFWFAYAVCFESKILNNSVMKFFSDISLEIYLSHMFVFRALEKLHLQYVFGDGWISYIFLCFLVLLGLICLIFSYKILVKFIYVIYLKLTHSI